MRFRKLIALFLSIIMLMSFSTMFVSAAEERSINYPKSWLDVGETLTLTLTLPSGASSVTWASSNASVATVTQTGVVTGISCGENLKITATYTVNGSPVVDEMYINVYDSRGIVNGEEYYIMNVSNSKVLSLASSSTANNTGIVTSSRGTSNTKKWRITRQPEGKYTFANMYTSASKGMYANASTNDVYLYTIGSSATRFEIERVNSGTYQGTYRIRYNGKYLTANSSNDVYLTATLNGNCYWSLSRVDKRDADFYGFSYEFTENDEDHYFDTLPNENNNLFFNMFADMGYSPYVGRNQTAIFAYEELISSDDIFLYAGHGGPGRIAFYTTGDTLLGRITADSAVLSNPNHTRHINSASNNALASLRFVIYLGCETGIDYITATNEYNLLSATYDKGAHFVLGTTQMLYDNTVCEWTKYFLEAIDGGQSLGSAIDSANNSIEYPLGIPIRNSNGTIGRTTISYFPVQCIGDTFQYLD